MRKAYDLDSAIRKVPDFPKPGIIFYDITGILVNPEAFSYCVDKMEELYRGRVDAVAAVESRGFIFAAPLAQRLGIPMILIRKKGKLPGKTISRSFALEYGEDTIEVHPQDVPDGARVLLLDDLIATGGTLKAASELLEEAGGRIVEIFGVVGLPFLNYGDKLEGRTITTLVDYHGE